MSIEEFLLTTPLHNVRQTPRIGLCIICSVNYKRKAGYLASATLSKCSFLYSCSNLFRYNLVRDNEDKITKFFAII